MKKTLISNLKKKGSKQYEFNVFECKKIDNDTVELSYPQPLDERQFVKDDKGHETYTKFFYEVDGAIIMSNQNSPMPIQPKVVGECGQMLQEAKVVRGITYPVKDFLKKKGFRIWDGRKKQWKKKTSFKQQQLW